MAALAALSFTAAASARSTANGLTINVFYSSNAFQASLSNGTALSSGTVVPPGPYSVVVYDSGADPNPQFTMAGPGASVSSNLNPTGIQIEVPMTFGPFVLPPSSSYTLSDANIGDGSTITFTTAATGSSATPSSSSKTSGTSTTSNGAPGSSTSASGSSRVHKTLTLSVGAGGKPSLTLAAKPVRKLKAGVYVLIVGDSSRTVGAFLGHGDAHLITLSGVTAVGTSVRNVTLTPGTWFYEGSPRGPRIYFTVS
jgi:hypothetical protein